MNLARKITNQNENNRVAYVGFTRAAYPSLSSYGLGDSGFCSADDLDDLMPILSNTNGHDYTNYNHAIYMANKLISDRTDTTKPCYIVFISDGVPTTSGSYYQYSDRAYLESYGYNPEAELWSVLDKDAGDYPWYDEVYPVDTKTYPTSVYPNRYVAAAERLAKCFKDNNPDIPVYTVGFNANESACDLLKKIATSENHFFNCADNSDFEKSMSVLRAEMGVAYPSGVLTDVIGEDFDLIVDAEHPFTVAGKAYETAEAADADDKIDINADTISWTLNEVDETGVRITFYVKLDTEKLNNENAEDLRYDTNKYAELVYVDLNTNDSKVVELHTPYVRTGYDVPSPGTTADLKIKKVDENGDPLTGAEFALYAVNGTEKILVGEYAGSSEYFVAGLKPGNYELVETKVPDGYAVPDGSILFTVNDATGLVTITTGSNAEITDEKTTTKTVKTGPVEIEINEVLPEILLALKPGEDTKIEESFENNDVVINRTAAAKTSEVEEAVKSSTGPTQAVAPVYDVIDNVKEDKGGMFDYQFNSGLTSKYSDPATWTDIPEDADLRYVGTGEHSKYYVAVAYVEYEKDENGNALVDENGNYIIKELRRYDDETSPVLTINGEETKELITEISLEPVYDNYGGSRPFVFVLKDRDGQAYYGYCCDLNTPANDGYYYTIGNLEDSHYYGSKEAEAHIRSIAMNGYWGTTGIPDENGKYAFGSLELLKEKLKAYIDANPELNTSLTAPVLDRNNKYQPVVDENGEIVYATKTMKQMVDGLTSGEALLATQAAFWTHANGSYDVLNGKDASIVLDPDGYKWNHDAMGSSKTAGGYTNGEAMDDFASTAVDFLYTWLINLETEEESTTVINEQNFVSDMTLELGNKVAENAYEADFSFVLDFEPSEKDDLLAHLSYTDVNGNSVELVKRIAGTGDGVDPITIKNGRYIIEGLELTENESVTFALRIEGKQYLERGTYVYLAHGGRENSQNFVGVMEGEKNVDVSKSVDFEFTANEEKYINNTYAKTESTLVVENTPVIPEKLGEKKDKLIDRDTNRYEVTIDVPGKDGDTRHDEVILMVDGSYSMDNEWPAMKEAITTIGETVLNGSGSTQLTLMAFGMGDNEVLVHVKDADELAAALGALPGNLLYGRSSTNCEAGFTGVAKYIKNHDESLKDVHVIFISDGNVNTDETPRAFDTNWQTWTKFGALNIAKEAFGGTVSNGENLPAAFTAIFGNRFDGKTKENIINEAFDGAVTDEEFLAFAEQIWTDVYAYSGLTRGKEYPVSDAERAFVKYDKEKGTYIQDLFYYTTYQSAYVTYGDRWTRTPAAANVLAARPEVKSMYVVDYDSYTAWMDTGITNEKSTFVQSNGIAGLCEALSGAMTELSKTPFNDVVVTDYMSKWVNLDPDTIKIIDYSTGEVIWTAAKGWLIDENRPTAQETPVIVKLVDPADYDDEDIAVIGNKSGDIYKLTWYVKDGAMLRADNYRLYYEVTVDTAEEGFEYDTELPANGNTDLHYKDENGKEQTNPIEVPDVDAPYVPDPTAELQLVKVDEGGFEILGAEFELFVVNGTEKTFVSRYFGDSTYRITGLKAGTYELVETVAPTGYLTMSDPVIITVDEDLNITVAENKSASFDGENLTIINRPPHAAVVLTLDMSGTMYRNKMNGERYVDIAKAKAIEFVEKYAASATNGAKRMLAVVCFDTDAKIQQDWIDVSNADGQNVAKKAINNIKVADDGNASSKKVCTNFDGGVILSRNLLKQDAVSNIDRCFNIILSDGAPTVTVNEDTDIVGTIKSSFWGNQLDSNGVKYQTKHQGGGWTHPAEVDRTLTYMNGLAEQTSNYTVDGEVKEGIFIIGIGDNINNLMNFKLFNDAVYGTSNGTRTSDVKKKPAAFNYVDALEGYSSDEIMNLTTGGWMTILADKVNGTYVSATDTAGLESEFNAIINAITENTTPAAAAANGNVPMFSARPSVNTNVSEPEDIEDTEDFIASEDFEDTVKSEENEDFVSFDDTFDSDDSSDSDEMVSFDEPADFGNAQKTINISFEKGTVSYIAYMTIDKESGKIDIVNEMAPKGRDTSADPIQLDDDTISAVYIKNDKNGKNGFIWTSEKVDKNTMRSLEKFLKRNTSEFTGYDMEIFGTGDHEISFRNNNGKKAKVTTVIYTFG